MRRSHARPSDLYWAIHEGAVKRIRAKTMTVATDMIGLLPLRWATGTGADVTRRLVAPLIGGFTISFVMELLVYPVIFYLDKRWELRKRVGRTSATDARRRFSSDGRGGRMRLRSRANEDCDRLAEALVRSNYFFTGQQRDGIWPRREKKKNGVSRRKCVLKTDTPRYAAAAVALPPPRRREMHLT